MSEILSKLIESLQAGDYIVVIPMTVVAVLFNYKGIIEFVDSRKTIQIDRLENILKDTYVTELDRELLENERVKEHFKLILGLDVEKDFREAIIKAHKDTKGEFKFRTFQRALPFFEYKEKTLKVTISWYDKVAFFINIFLSFSFIFTGYSLFIYGLAHFSSTYILYIFAFIFISIGFFIIYALRHIISAKKVKKELEKSDIL